ncbi:MAG: response regulator transcription factor [Pseudomonadota bacterium]|uniref:response regulator transcription factor n=1 Tax=unclassified Phenylobacterium TaxID=2640670 RepID=UPI0006FB5B04|nr:MULTISPECIES: response regulator transcription factor [unclassified Phenylobacterium]KRB52876.1 two-component system response regulator [Phenylobacterium sp. Root700]MBT9471072.1 response regulator transcription factor [Phenylobacterium sp.]
MRALVVEDDPDVGPDLVRALTAAGFTVDLAKDGEDASFKGSVETYAAVVLDLGLPRLDGLSVLRRWRAEGLAFPVLVLSARGDWTEKVEGIEAGADDYLAKPFQMGELVARFRALVRRAAGRTSPVITLGRLNLDTRRMSATLDGAPIRLSPLEFRLLDCLAHQPGRAVSAGELAEHLYGAAESGDANAIEALVTRLRRKIGADVVETRRGFGYLLATG